jgi:predicted permease
MPASFSFPMQSPPIALWTAAGEDDQFFTQRGAAVLEVIGRLKAGVSLAKSKADMDVIAHNLAAKYADTNKQHSSIVDRPLLEQLVGDNRPALRILFGAVALVLLIACANVAGLLLARATRRRPEIALQAALGASPGGIIRQILVESLCVAIAAGALGIALSAAAVKWLPRFVPKSLPRLDQVSIDGTVLAFAVAASILTGLVFGVLPAWRMSRFDPLEALREGSRSLAGTRSRYRLQSWLVIAETALGLVLLVGSGLLIRSFIRVLNVSPGFDSRNVLTARISVPASRYKRAQRIDFYHRFSASLVRKQYRHRHYD